MLFSFAACGEEKMAEKPSVFTVSLTVSVKGTLQLSCQAIELPDVDVNGEATLDQVLQVAHANYCHEENAYKTEDGGYGLALTCLWGDDNGVSGYGYYINDKPAMNLEDKVKNGDSVCAFSYKDLETWSDTYTWFSDVKQDGKTCSFKLLKAGYDEAWNPIDLPAANCTVNANGTDVCTTNENGEGSFSIESIPTDMAIFLTVSKTDENLVPPVKIVLPR